MWPRSRSRPSCTASSQRPVRAGGEPSRVLTDAPGAFLGRIVCGSGDDGDMAPDAQAPAVFRGRGVGPCGVSAGGAEGQRGDGVDVGVAAGKRHTLWRGAAEGEQLGAGVREQARTGAAQGVELAVIVVPTRWATTMRSLLVAASAQEATSQGSGQELDCTTRALSSPSSSFSRALRAMNSGSASQSRGAGAKRSAFRCSGVAPAPARRGHRRVCRVPWGAFRGRGAAGGGRAEPGQGVQDPGPAGEDLGRQGWCGPAVRRERTHAPDVRARKSPKPGCPVAGASAELAGRVRMSLSRCQEIEPTGVLRGYHALVACCACSPPL